MDDVSKARLQASIVRTSSKIAEVREHTDQAEKSATHARDYLLEHGGTLSLGEYQALLAILRTAADLNTSNTSQLGNIAELLEQIYLDLDNGELVDFPEQTIKIHPLSGWYFLCGQSPMVSVM